MGFRYSVNEKFFKEWSPTMAYILGFIYADGALIDDKRARGKYLVITSIDQIIIQQIKNWMAAEHPITKTIPPKKHHHFRYVLRIGNKNIYASLTELGLFQNKSLTVTMPTIPKKFIQHFVRGYFDGDGCISFWKTTGKLGQPIIRKLSVIFTSGSKKFLEGLLFSLKKLLELRQDKIYNSHRSFQLRLGTKDSVKMFNFMYIRTPAGTFLQRKFDTFQEYFKMKHRIA